MGYLTKRLSESERKELEEWLKKIKAKGIQPYTEEDMKKPQQFDGEIDPVDFARGDAYMIKKMIEEDDEMKAKGL